MGSREKYQTNGNSYNVPFLKIISNLLLPRNFGNLATRAIKKVQIFNIFNMMVLQDRKITGWQKVLFILINVSELFDCVQVVSVRSIIIICLMSCYINSFVSQF